jgi:hypothetical protein
VTNDPQHQQWLDSLVAMPATTADDFAGWRITRNLGLCITELFAYGTGVVVETAS